MVVMRLLSAHPLCVCARKKPRVIQTLSSSVAPGLQKIANSGGALAGHRKHLSNTSLSQSFEELSKRATHSLEGIWPLSLIVPRVG